MFDGCFGGNFIVSLNWVFGGSSIVSLIWVVCLNLAVQDSFGL